MKVPEKIIKDLLPVLESTKDEIGEDTFTVAKAALAIGDSQKIATLAGIFVCCLPMNDFKKLYKAITSDEAFTIACSNTLIYEQEK